MTDVVIRPITPDDDMDAQLDLGQRAFGAYSPAQAVSWLHIAQRRARQGMFLGAFVDGRPAGAAMLHEMRQWWLGRAVPCAGVASVKVAPEHRGRGIGRRLTAAVLETAAERRYPLSALFPATMPLYRALGWELAGGTYEAAVPARSLRTLAVPDFPAAPEAAATGVSSVSGGPGGAVVAGTGQLRRARPDDAAAVIALIGRTHRLARDAGPLTWDEGPTRQWLARDDMCAYLAGEDGFVAYRWAAGSEELFVERVHAVNPASLRSLWAVIASHGSVARTVRARVAPNDPFWWLTQERDATLTQRSLWMLRVVDAPAAIAARGFPPAVGARVTLEINDQSRPVNSGRWQLTVADGQGLLVPNGPVSSPGPSASASARGGSATRAGGDCPPLTLGARGLAALYAGTPVTTLRLAGLAAGGGPEADDAINAAFAATPYMLDDF